MKKLICITFEIVTPESAEQGDVAERGWIDEEGDEFEDDETETAADLAAKYLIEQGACEPSSSWAHDGVWYSDEGTPDYATGAVETRSYHLKGFTLTEQLHIYDRVKGAW
jgi:hypothetical protein